jgi:hypothetical protein
LSPGSARLFQFAARFARIGYALTGLWGIYEAYFTQGVALCYCLRPCRALSVRRSLRENRLRTFQGIYADNHITYGVKTLSGFVLITAFAAGQ